MDENKLVAKVAEEHLAVALAITIGMQLAVAMTIIMVLTTPKVEATTITMRTGSVKCVVSGA